MPRVQIFFNNYPEMIGQRIDKALTVHPAIRSRSRAEYLLNQQRVIIKGKFPKSSYKIVENDVVIVELPDEVQSVGLMPLDRKLDIYYEDDELLVINKPAGLVVHPAVGHEQDTLVNALINHTQNLSMKFNEQRPGIVHRLDKDTSGLLVIAKNDKAHEFLAKQFKERTIHRIYFAVCSGEMNSRSGTIQSRIARHPTHRKKFASTVSLDAGKMAITHFEVLKVGKNKSYIKLKLETGRTHQIRVHLSEKRHPILGDTLYGSKEKNLSRFLLHAAELGFLHPTTGKWLQFKAPWPETEIKMLNDFGLLEVIE